MTSPLLNQPGTNSAASSLSIEDKRSWIAQRLEDLFSRPNKFELVALDFEVNLMTCAAQSYKHETVLKPFPSTFLSDSNNNKNYEQLVRSSSSSACPTCPHLTNLCILWSLLAERTQIASTRLRMEIKDWQVRSRSVGHRLLAHGPQELWARIQYNDERRATQRVGQIHWAVQQAKSRLRSQI